MPEQPLPRGHGGYVTVEPGARSACLGDANHRPARPCFQGSSGRCHRAITRCLLAVGSRRFVHNLTIMGDGFWIPFVFDEGHGLEH
jgi:hypothetical protein